MQFSPTVLIWAPIGLLFLSAIVGILIERHTKDGCLRVFNGDFVILRMKDGHYVWGTLRVFPNCLELTYDSPQPMGPGRSKASYVLYSKKMAEIERIYRPAPTEGTLERGLWQEEIDELRRIGFLGRMGRGLRNLYGMMRDAFSQSIGMVMGVAKQSSKALQQVGGADKHATEVGQSLLKILPHAYEPVFEVYRGSLVVVESVVGGAIQESVGVLEDYSVANLLLRGVEVVAGDLPAALVERRFGVCDVVFPRTSAIVRHRVAESAV